MTFHVRRYVAELVGCDHNALEPSSRPPTARLGRDAVTYEVSESWAATVHVEAPASSDADRADWRLIAIWPRGLRTIRIAAHEPIAW
jgi:hypothetical protein